MVSMRVNCPCLIHARYDAFEFEHLDGILVQGERYAEVEP
jgi:hypothetical protein